MCIFYYKKENKYELYQILVLVWTYMDIYAVDYLQTYIELSTELGTSSYIVGLVNWI